MTATQMLAQHPPVSPPARELPEIRWTSPESTLWVATRGADFAGFVEFREGHYAVTNGIGAQLKHGATLGAAQALIGKPNSAASHPAALTGVSAAAAGLLVTVPGAGLTVPWMV